MEDTPSFGLLNNLSIETLRVSKVSSMKSKNMYEIKLNFK